MADWSDTTTQAALGWLKVNLGVNNSIAYDERLTQVINASKGMIVREGVSTLSDSDEDVQLVVMVAEWLWRKRESGEGMPRMIRWALNNRIFSEKARS